MPLIRRIIPLLILPSLATAQVINPPKPAVAVRALLYTSTGDFPSCAAGTNDQIAFLLTGQNINVWQCASPGPGWIDQGQISGGAEGFSLGFIIPGSPAGLPTCDAAIDGYGTFATGADTLEHLYQCSSLVWTDRGAVSAPISATPGTGTKVTINAAGQATSVANAALASADYANQGTTVTVLHGNGSGNPSWGAVSLTADVTGVLPAANGGVASGSYAGTWSATAIGALGDNVNFISPLNAPSFAGTVGTISCSWATAGVTGGGTDIAVMKIRDVTATSDLCSCTLSMLCTATANTIGTCACASGAMTAGHSYAVQFASGTSCSTNPSAVGCAVELKNP